MLPIVAFKFILRPYTAELEVKQERDAARSACKVAEARLAGVDLGAIERDTADMRLLVGPEPLVVCQSGNQWFRV